MQKAPQSQELESGSRASPVGEIFDLTGLVRGTAETASPLPDGEAKEVQKLLSGCVPGLDLEYPTPRHVLQHGYREQLRVGDLTLQVDAPSQGDLQQHPSVRVEPQARVGASTVESDRVPLAGSSRGPAGITALVAAGAIGALIAAGLVLLVLAIADSGAPGVPLAVTLVALTMAISVAIWRAIAPAAESRPSMEMEGPAGWTDMWALRVGASFREAIAVSLRTGGLGLLVRPLDSALDESRSDDADNPRGGKAS
jgi:hypothetical protein